MKKNLTSALMALKKNRGSGLVLVLVCMLCVSILGIMLLYLTYTGVLLKTTERQSKADLYSASTAMDEIRTGIQAAVSDSIAGAYNDAMANYSNASYLADGQNMQSKFQDVFIEKLKSWTVAENKQLIDNTGKYNTDTLSGFIKSGMGNATVVSVSNCAVSTDDTKKTVTLKGVRVTYTDAKGYTTTITSDIVISAPEFSYVKSNYSTAGLPSYAIIAKLALINSSIDHTIEGSAYASDTDISSSTLSCSNGTYISKAINAGSISGTASGNFSADEKTSVWTNRITLGQTSNILLKGDTYVQDDLDLAGFQSSATLAGNYFGYGNSTTDSSKSSAIVVNGRQASLSLAGVSSLMLAGHSFVENSKVADDVLMGESVSVRGNQTVYLIPKEYLSLSGGNAPTSNPYIYNSYKSSSVPTATLNNNGQNALAEKYNVSVKTVSAPYPGSDQGIVYYFMQFNDTKDGTGKVTTSAESNANKFFADYFAQNKSKIAEYLAGYITSFNSTKLSRSAGWILTKEGSGYALGSAPSKDWVGNSPAQLNTTFKNLCTTLSARSDTAENPYEYFTNTPKLEQLTNTKYFHDQNNVNVGVAVNGNFTVDATDSNKDLNVVIASGSVTVNRDFIGIVIAGGNIILKGNIKADNTLVSQAFTASNNGELLGSYLLNGAGNSMDNSSSGNGSSWNLGKLVTYQNWSKN
jgi:hypothetical protein